MKEEVDNETVDLIDECRTVLVLCTLLDKSGQALEMVDKIDKWLEKHNK